MTALVQKNQLAPKIGWEVYSTVFAMFLYTLLEFGIKGVALPGILILGVSSINYMLILFLYVGIALLAYQGHTWLLWGSAVLVYIIGYMFTGLDFAWTMLSQWSMILFGGFVIGRLTLKQEANQKVYTIGMVAVLLFALSMYLPLLSKLTAGIAEASADMLATAQTSMPTMGYSAEETATWINGMNVSLAFVQRIFPALLILSAVFQYSIGYMIFNAFISRKESTVESIPAFTLWKMPFYLTPLLLGAACLRFFGGESLRLVGDNILVFLTVFYSIAGLSLIDYYLKKLKFPSYVKVSFYILLFFTGHLGFVVTVFAGFIDSFKNFRKSDQLNLQNE